MRVNDKRMDIDFENDFKSKIKKIEELDIEIKNLKEKLEKTGKGKVLLRHISIYYCYEDNDRNDDAVIKQKEMDKRTFHKVKEEFIQTSDISTKRDEEIKKLENQYNMLLVRFHERSKIVKKLNEEIEKANKKTQKSKNKKSKNKKSTKKSKNIPVANGKDYEIYNSYKCLGLYETMVNIDSSESTVRRSIRRVMNMQKKE